MSTMLDGETLRKRLHYDAKTGVFTWKIWVNNRGYTIAGSVDPDGYRWIGVEGKRYPASRLAFLWMTGSFPENDCDHEDGNPSNDAWENLRDATVTQNLRNKRVQSNNKLGLKGVTEHEPGKYRARIKGNGKQIHLGVFNSAEEAHQAYIVAAKKYFGAFARG